MNKKIKLILAALKILEKDAKNELKKALRHKDYGSAYSSRCYLNGIQMAIRVVTNAEDR